MKDLIIVRGIPGSGKSTFAKKLSRAICTADDYFTDKFGNYKWDPYKIGIAHKWCRRKCERFMKNNIPTVVVANTSTTSKEINTYKKIAQKYEYRVFSIIVENRHEGINCHDVPEETLDKMKERFDIKL